MTGKESKAPEGWWHLYYKVSLAFILAGLAAFGTIYWFDRTRIENTCSRIDKVEQKVCDLNERVNVHRSELDSLQRMDHTILFEIRSGNQRILEKMMELHKYDGVKK